MRVKELIELLSKCNPNDLVVIAQHDTTASPLDGISEDVYEEDKPWCGDIKLRTLPEDDTRYTEEDLGVGEDCVTLCPIN